VPADKVDNLNAGLTVLMEREGCVILASFTRAPEEPRAELLGADWAA
jgi:hypothetical protein